MLPSFTVREIIAVLFGLLAFLAVLALLEGCSAPQSSRPPECQGAGYEALLVTCNQLAETLTESIACENRVRRHCGRPLRDGGSDAQ